MTAAAGPRELPRPSPTRLQGARLGPEAAGVGSRPHLAPSTSARIRIKL